jgi:sigma-B regulation protein RsbU (phosphoserine phosphatase)
MNRIVVIEDDTAILRGLADNLRAEAYEVLTAIDGEAGFQLVRDNQPDLVILDLMLPKLDGYEICRRIRQRGIATPILMLTAQDNETNRVEGFEAGADDYVTKPFSIRELLGRVKAILRRSEGRSDLANQKELNEARQIQERLLPSNIPQIPGFHIAGTSRPAHITGGDYFDVLKFDDGSVGVCIGDVSGKGMPAAMMMATLQATVKACASKRTHPRELCERVNRVMCENTPSNGFVSFFYAVIVSGAAGRRRLTYCNAGHNPPILSTRGGAATRLESGGGILGVFPNWDYEEQEVRLNAGDSILMYTDGITETRNTADEEFGEERLIDLIRLFRDKDAAALTRETISAASSFSNGKFEDDLTVVAVSVN